MSADSQAYRRMLRRAAHLLSGDDVSEDESLAQFKGSKFHHLKELRPGSAGAGEIRILFAFDPATRAVLLVAGDKAGDWKRWYVRAIELAELRYEQWIKEMGT